MQCGRKPEKVSGRNIFTGAIGKMVYVIQGIFGLVFGLTEIELVNEVLEL